MKATNLKSAEVFHVYMGADAKFNSADFSEDMEQVNRNVANVLQFALSIESSVKMILLEAIFYEVKEMRDVISSLILDSDWCTFSAKRRLLQQVVESRKLLEGKDKARLTELFAKVIRYRNALTHGEIAIDGVARSIKLTYFEGNPVTKELSDEYWTDVEETFLELHVMLMDLQESVFK